MRGMKHHLRGIVGTLLKANSTEGLFDESPDLHFTEKLFGRSAMMYDTRSSSSSENVKQDDPGSSFTMVTDSNATHQESSALTPVASRQGSSFHSTAG